VGIAASGPLVGRVAELAVLDEAIREAVAGSVQIVAISGEGGIGKSRLALGRVAVVQGERFSHPGERCGAAAKGSVVRPIVEALRPLVAEAALVGGLSDLARLSMGSACRRSLRSGIPGWSVLGCLRRFGY
jgi:hypothetical protein